MTEIYPLREFTRRERQALKRFGLDEYGNDCLSPYPHIAVEMRGERGHEADVMAYVHGSPEEIRLLLPFLEQLVTNMREVSGDNGSTEATK